MKKKLVLSAMLVCLLALGLAVIGCSSDDDGGGGTQIPTAYQNTVWVATNALNYETSSVVGGKIEFTTNSVKATKPDGVTTKEFECTEVFPKVGAGNEYTEIEFVGGTSDLPCLIRILKDGTKVEVVHLCDGGTKFLYDETYIYTTWVKQQ